MTRIIAGSARGRRLAVPPSGTRPTADRAREGLFNSLLTLMDFDGANVLDLFAGSGAVGLEALSRGAASAVLVEQNANVIAVLRTNIAAVGLSGATLVQRSVAAYLTGGPAAGGTGFDLVFADPPYALGDDEIVSLLTELTRPGWLHPNAIIVVERSARGGGVQWPPPLEHLKQKRYGEASFWYGQQR